MPTDPSGLPDLWAEWVGAVGWLLDTREWKLVGGALRFVAGQKRQKFRHPLEIYVKLKHLMAE